MLTRRETLRGGTAAVAVIAGAGALAAVVPRDPLREGVQALVREIREDLSGDVICASYGTLQQVATRLEALPGIDPIRNDEWDARYRAILADAPLGWSWRYKL